MDTAQIVRDFIVENFLFGSGDVSLDTHLIESQVIDSTGILELFAFLEERFGVRPADDEMVPENFGTIRSIAGFIERKSGGSSPAP